MTSNSTEPKIKIGIIDRRNKVSGRFNRPFTCDGLVLNGEFHATVENGTIILQTEEGEIRGTAIHCSHDEGSTFTLRNVIIGIKFHWEREEDQTFEGDLVLVARDDATMAAINEVSVEDYLASVISSEMSAEAPMELLKAHAITSRSWLLAMLEREKREQHTGSSSQRTIQREGELIRWYDREDHDLFDVCADDHCQRYQGITKMITPNAASAVQQTRGVALTYAGEICDARFSKACGGFSENFENAWEDKAVPYLRSMCDSDIAHSVIRSEQDAERWILSQPEAYCSTTDGNVLRQLLPSFDQETTDFFRWTVKYDREELENIIRSKSGMDFGTLLGMTPIARGPSGRIIKLKIQGSKKTLIIGKELEIRRWLSKSHLYSSAFVVKTENDRQGIPVRFILHGAGWGHGVGLCQIGAAIMARNGFAAEQIGLHYFRGAKLEQLY